MPTFDTDRGAPLPFRVRAFADALEVEGRPRTAARVRAAADSFEDLVEAGQPRRAHRELRRTLAGLVPTRCLPTPPRLDRPPHPRPRA